MVENVVSGIDIATIVLERSCLLKIGIRMSISTHKVNSTCLINKNDSKKCGHPERLVIFSELHTTSTKGVLPTEDIVG